MVSGPTSLSLTLVTRLKKNLIKRFRISPDSVYYKGGTQLRSDARLRPAGRPPSNVNDGGAPGVKEATHYSLSPTDFLSQQPNAAATLLQGVPH